MVREGYTGMSDIPVPSSYCPEGDIAEGWGAMLHRTPNLSLSRAQMSGGTDRITSARKGLSATLGSARRRRNESGAAAVEFALVLVPFLTLVFGIIQYGLYFYGAQSGSHAANSAIRQLSVGNCQSPGTLQTYLDNQLGDGLGNADLTSPNGVTYVDSGGITVSPNTLPASAVGGTVTLKFKFSTPNMHFPLLPYLSDSSVTREVQARIEDTTDGGCGS